MADVEFDAVSLNAGATIFLNGTHSLSALHGNKFLAAETNGEEVESTDTDSIIASFATDHYENDALTNNLKNASLTDISTVNSHRAFLPSVDKDFWLSDESSTYGITTQAWRTATNGAETKTIDAQGKAPDGTLFTPAPDWAARDYINYKFNNNPLKSFELNGFDIKDLVQLEDCSWAGKTYLWDKDSTERITCWEYETTIEKTIYPGKEVYNNPWCIEDPARGFYKTTAAREWDIPNGIGGRIETYGGSDSVEPEVFLACDYRIYKDFNEGDIFFLDVTSNYLQDTTGFLHYRSNKCQHAEFYNIYFKAEEDGELTRQFLYIGPEAIGWHSGKEDGGEVTGLPIEAGKHAVRPSWTFDNIAFFRESTSSNELDTSSSLGDVPQKRAYALKDYKCSVLTNDVEINFDLNVDNCSTDRDQGRNKCTKVEGTTIKVPWKSKELTIKNVETGNANYISALVQTSDNKKYGVLAKADGSDVKLDLTNILSNTLIGDKITVSLYAEKANDAGFSDEISATPVTFQVEIAALAPQRIVYDANGGSGEIPEDTVAKAGEQVKIADGSGLYGATGNPFSYWELSYEPFEQTGQVVRKYHSGDQLVMPDAITYPDCGIITAKAIYSGGIEVEKTSDTSGEYNRVLWDSNQGSDFEARIGSEDGDKTKTTLFKSTDGVATITASEIPAVVNITDNSEYVFIGWSKNKNAKKGDEGIYKSSDLNNTSLTEKKTTYYAVWHKYVETYYWLGTANAGDEYTDEEKFALNDTNYYSGLQIKEDMKILHRETTVTDEEYNAVLAKWNTFYTNDIRLYTTYEGGATIPCYKETEPVNHPKNGLAEFRIIEVSGSGGHLNVENDKTSGDGSVVSFMQVHALPTAYQMNSTLTSSGGWNSSELHGKFVAGGEIYERYNNSFLNQAKAVPKLNNAGGGSSKTTMGETSTDKLWLLSYSELFSTSLTYVDDVPTGEGAVYQRFRSHIYGTQVNDRVTNNCCTRSGNAPGVADVSNYESDHVWLRSPRTINSYDFKYITYFLSVEYGIFSTRYQIVRPCVAF